MAVSTIAVPKRKIAALRNIPRDIFDSVEGLTGAGAPDRILLRETYGGLGLDLTIINAAAAVNAANILIDKTKVVTLAPGAVFNMSDVLFALIEVFDLLGGGIVVDVYFSGVSRELLEEI